MRRARSDDGRLQVRPCYGPLFLSRALEKGDHNMGTVASLQIVFCISTRIASTNKINHTPVGKLKIMIFYLFSYFEDRI